jgi:GNAT superfamily N-acetyltransferase
MKQPILSFTLQQILKEVDPNHIHHAEYTAALDEPFLIKAYGSSLLFGVYSSKYAKNGRVYQVKVIFKDIVIIARDKQIPIADAVRYAIEDLDMNISCQCPAFLFYGYRYMGTQLSYLYGLPREHRPPRIRNPKMRGSVCKHADKVMRWIVQNEDEIIGRFEALYRKIDFAKALEDFEAEHPEQAKKAEEEKKAVDAPPEETLEKEGSSYVGDGHEDEEETAEEIAKREQEEWEAQRNERKTNQSLIIQGGAPMTPAFKAWFGDSKVVDPKGNPLPVYRGEHGAFHENKDLTSKLASYTFGADPETANLYATEPNDRRDTVEAPRVIPVYLRIENPFINAPDDPFIDLSYIQSKLGRAAAEAIALAHADHIRDTGSWMENVNEDGEFDTIQDVIDNAPQKLGELCFLTFQLLDGFMTEDGKRDSRFVELIKSKGYDGAIYMGMGDNSDDIEYRIFSQNQAKSVYNSGGWSREDSRLSQSLVASAHLYKAYHGSERAFESPDISKGPEGFLYFTDSEEHASRFGKVTRYTLSMNNPMRIDMDDLYAATTEEDEINGILPRNHVIDFVTKAKKEGHDGLIIDGFADFDLASTVYIPFSNDQISAYATQYSLFSADTRSISYVSTKFPSGLTGVSDIHSTSQLNGLLNSFGRGIVDPATNEVRLGPAGSSHIGLSKGIQDAKRFYYGYSRADKTVYVVSKNSMDDAFFQKSSVLQRILSQIFDLLRLSVTPGQRLIFQAEGRTLTLWHGGDLSRDTAPSHRAGDRTWYGPGLYLTTHYGTAAKYAKGGRRLYRVVILEGNDARKVILDKEATTAFITSYVKQSKRKEVLSRCQKYFEGRGLDAEVFGNIIGNEDALSSTRMSLLRQFYVDNGVDYLVVDNAFGWGERMIVLYNMGKIISKDPVSPKDQIDTFDLDTEFAGEPVSSSLNAYHGSENDFDTFDLSLTGTSSGNKGFLGEGIYFSTEKERAEAYGNVKEYTLDLKNPLLLEGTLSEEIADILSQATDGGAFYEGTTAKDAYNGLAQVCSDFPEVATYIKDYLEGEGYDGIIYNHGQEIVVFDLSVIKPTQKVGSSYVGDGHFLPDPTLLRSNDYGEAYRHAGKSDEALLEEAGHDYDYYMQYHPEILKGKTREEFLQERLAYHKKTEKRLREFPVKEKAARELGKYEPEDLAALGFDEEDYAEFHRTGFIEPRAYKSFDDPDLWSRHPEGKNYVKDGSVSSGDYNPKEENPVDHGTIQGKDGKSYDVRSSGEKLQYTKLDGDEIVRGPDGRALTLSDEEIAAKGLPSEDTTLLAYDGEQLVAIASDEFGTDGIWVHPDYRGQGIGPRLLRMFRSQFKHRGKHGQATPGGYNMYRKYFRAYANSSTFVPESYDIASSLVTQDREASVFLYRSEEVVRDKIRNRTRGSDILKTLRNNGVPADEIDALKLNTFLDTTRIFSPEDILDYIERNKLKIKEVERKRWDRDELSVPERKAYTEALLTFEGDSEFKTVHWDDVDNLFAHARLSSIDVNGKRTLFIEEIQSDWHEAGRRKKYQSEGGPIADAPFKQSWPRLMFRYVLHRAAIEGFDGIAWGSGSLHADRYDPTKYIDHLDYRPSTTIPGGWDLDAHGRKHSCTDHDLPDAVGTGMAAKIRDGAGTPSPFGKRLSTDDLKINDEGLAFFYDSIIKGFAKKTAAKYGSSVQDIEVAGFPAYFMEINDAMYSAMEKGVVLFQSDSFIAQSVEVLAAPLPFPLVLASMSDQIELGIAVEHEHTASREEAKKIALDHLKENPEYYTELFKAGLIDEPAAVDMARRLFSSLITQGASYDNYKDVISQEHFDKLMSLDPTPNGKFGKWFMQLYKYILPEMSVEYSLPFKYGIDEETDADSRKLAFRKVYNALAASRPFLASYSRAVERKKLSAPLNNILNFKTFQALADAIGESPEWEAFLEDDNHRNFKEQIEVLYDSPDWFIWSPKTHAASCAYGKNTEWCTATEKTGSYFRDYTATAPLIGIRRKSDGHKWQIWDNGDSTDWEGMTKAEKIPENQRTEFLLALPEKAREALASVKPVPFKPENYLTAFPALLSYLEKVDPNYTALFTTKMKRTLDIWVTDFDTPSDIDEEWAAKVIKALKLLSVANHELEAILVRNVRQLIKTYSLGEEGRLPSSFHEAFAEHIPSRRDTLDISVLRDLSDEFGSEGFSSPFDFIEESVSVGSERISSFLASVVKNGDIEVLDDKGVAFTLKALLNTLEYSPSRVLVEAVPLIDSEFVTALLRLMCKNSGHENIVKLCVYLLQNVNSGEFSYHAPVTFDLLASLLDMPGLSPTSLATVVDQSMHLVKPASLKSADFDLVTRFIKTLLLGGNTASLGRFMDSMIRNGMSSLRNKLMPTLIADVPSAFSKGDFDHAARLIFSIQDPLDSSMIPSVWLLVPYLSNIRGFTVLPEDQESFADKEGKYFNANAIATSLQSRPGSAASQDTVLEWFKLSDYDERFRKEILSTTEAMIRSNTRFAAMCGDLLKMGYPSFDLLRDTFPSFTERSIHEDRPESLLPYTLFSDQREEALSFLLSDALLTKGSTDTDLARLIVGGLRHLVQEDLEGEVLEALKDLADIYIASHAGYSPEDTNLMTIQFSVLKSSVALLERTVSSPLYQYLMYELYTTSSMSDNMKFRNASIFRNVLSRGIYRSSLSLEGWAGTEEEAAEFLAKIDEYNNELTDVKSSRDVGFIERERV